MAESDERRLIPHKIQCDLAKRFKSLHAVTSDRDEILCLVNVSDPDSVAMILLAAADAVSHGSKPLQGFTTASYGMALLAGTTDEELTWAQCAPITKVVAEEIYRLTVDTRLLPLTIDIQDGYDELLESVIEQVIIEAGAVEVNIENLLRPSSADAAPTLRPLEEAVERVQRVMKVAVKMNIPDFVIAARTDAIMLDGNVEEAIRRGKAYLSAGATIIAIMGGPGRGLHTQEMVHIIDELDGKVSFKLAPGGLTLDDLTWMGPARVTMGPALPKKNDTRKAS